MMRRWQERQKMEKENNKKTSEIIKKHQKLKFNRIRLLI